MLRMIGYVEIGFRYLGMFAPTMAIGYTLKTRQEQRARLAGAVPKVA